MKTICRRVSIGISALAILFVYGLVATAMAGLTPEQARELGEIQKAIKAKGAKWTAGETSVFRLSREQRKRLCGVLFFEQPGMVPAGGATQTAPTAGTDYLPWFDWRYEDPAVVRPIKDQGHCGSCWAFAAVGAMESTLMINANPSGEDLSEQFVVSCDKSNFGCNGGYMNRVYDFLTTTGTTDEDCFPYTSGLRGASPPCKKRCGDWEARAENIRGWQWVANTEDDIKDAVYCTGPVPCTMYVYADFYSYASGVYQYTEGQYQGGHAVIIIGWGTENGLQYWLCKNSWGTGWGEQGYFKIKLGECGIGDNAAKYAYLPGECPDNDGDGYTDEACGGSDCDDSDPAINPGAEDTCDSVDSNCDGYDGYDNDSDGYSTCDDDCDDSDKLTYPGAAELCDGKDNNCDGSLAPGEVDADNDGVLVCAGDCDDNNPDTYPGGPEICDDGIDNNCDGRVDEGCSTCTPAGELCNSDEQCCSGKCKGKPGNKTCR